MTASTVASIVLGLGAFLTAIYSVVTQLRDRGRSVRKQEGDILLDEQTRDRLAAEAAQINADQRIATERWWKEQFDAVKTELVIEQAARRRLTKWANAHQEWDKGAWRLAQKINPSYPPPPRIDED